VILSGRARRSLPHRPLMTIDLEASDAAEQRAVWQAVLATARAAGPDLDGHIDELVAQFSLEPAMIEAALHWGATRDEVEDQLPGDEIVARPSWQSTRAIDIAAPVEQVWPWLAQMGEDRGGLYSYDWLENLAGLEFHSANRIVLDWQTVQVGGIVRFAPKQDTMVVTQVEPNHCLVWRVLNPSTHEPADATWAFVLRPIDATHIRLIQRFRFGVGPRLLGAIFYTALIEIAHFVMERKMLLGIRARAERAYALGPFRSERLPGLL
jgi:hypothetical protein